MDEYNREITQFREYLKNEIEYYNNGIMCSLAESMQGEKVATEILNKFNELFKEL